MDERIGRWMVTWMDGVIDPWMEALIFGLKLDEWSGHSVDGMDGWSHRGQKELGNSLKLYPCPTCDYKRAVPDPRRGVGDFTKYKC